MIKYVARVGGRYGVRAEITEVEVERETDVSVWVGGRRHGKDTEWATYFDTWDEAKIALTAKQSSYIHSLRGQLERANGIAGNIRGLKQ